MKHKALLFLAIFMLIFVGCTQREQASGPVSSTASKEAVTVAKPQEAVTAIYASLSAYKAEPIKFSDLGDTLGVAPSSVSEYYGMISEASEGLADVVILLPKDQERDNVNLALSKYKEKRMASFENFDILDAYAISQGAVIYEQGGYIIMLMLADNDAAREIIDEYIPL